MAADIFPPSAQGIPRSLTTPSIPYRASVVLVLFSLLLYIALYFAIVAAAGFLVYLTVIMPIPVSVYGLIAKIGLITASVALFLFLGKGIFHRTPQVERDAIEVRPNEQPDLFRFLYRMCDEIGAPRPHKVYFNHRVNAAVFYDASLLNLIIPVRKNLLIGLGLVNALNLSEFRSVLAHEFGHFSQRSLALGQYVQIVGVLAHNMVFGRDVLDDWLDDWRENEDFRISVWGYLVAGAVWVVRGILWFSFIGVLAARRLMSLQQEYHADLVAVSVCGSDAGVHALRRLLQADAAFQLALADLQNACSQQLFARDFFVIQKAAIERLRRSDGSGRFSDPPALPDDLAATTQVFQLGDDGIPTMWDSHPSSYDRERNAKRRYYRSPLDDRPAWLLFRDPEHLRATITRWVYSHELKISPQTLQDSSEILIRLHGEQRVNPTGSRCGGFYEDRPLRIDDLATAVASGRQRPLSPAQLKSITSRLYSGELASTVAEYRRHVSDYLALQRAVMTAIYTGAKQFAFRGIMRAPADAGPLKSLVEKELEEDHRFQASLDRQVLLAHLQMAAALDRQRAANLYGRYDFHLRLQKTYEPLREAWQQVDNLASFPADQMPQLPPDFGKWFKAAYDGFATALAQAETLEVPAFSGLSLGGTLRGQLMEQPLPSPLPEVMVAFPRDAVQNVRRHFQAIHNRVETLFHESLEQLLALQEQIHTDYSDSTAVVAVAADADAPPAAAASPAPADEPSAAAAATAVLPGTPLAPETPAPPSASAEG